MKSLAVVLLLAAAAAAEPVDFRESGFTAGPDGVPAGWKNWSPRDEIAPRVFVDRARFRTRTGSLAVTGNGVAGVFGGPQRAVSAIQPGAWYRFTAYYRSAGVPHESLQVLPRVDWTAAGGKRAGPPDFVWRTAQEGDWMKTTADVQAPPQATEALLQLFIFNAPQGTIWWDDVSFEAIPAPAPRPVTIATIFERPSSTREAAASVARFLETVERTVTVKTDLILLPEGITVIGTGKQYAEVAETIPGPTTARLSELARRRSSWVAAGIYEREGATLYNTAVLIDRRGEIAGKYRKVYLPYPEIEGGLTPGNEFPVFRTDFGTVGMMICYDVFFAHPAHALARQGAEILLLPIWGGNEVLARARTIEEKAFLVTSGYDHPTYIMDPLGERIAEAREKGTAAIATIDLNRRYTERGLGDMRSRRMREARVDVR